MPGTEGAAPKMENVAGEPIVPANGNTSDPTVDQIKQHVQDRHLKMELQNGTLIVNFDNDCGTDSCPVPKRIGIFYCRRPPCP